ncbi:MAG: hypothetical protein ACLFVC_01015 [Opitutales bacterium]
MHLISRISHLRRFARRFALPLVCLGLAGFSSLAAAEYSWQKPHINILPNGDLEWAPESYRFVAGDEVRYIDYENGDDANSGATKKDPWKHHPWDRDATGKAKAATGPITYVFKGGVIYRGQLEAKESGEPGNPIRLTADPSWGEGRPWIFGSSKLPAKWVKASEVEHPERLPEPDKVWALNLKEAGFQLHDDGLVFTQIQMHPAKNGPRTKTPTPPSWGFTSCAARANTKPCIWRAPPTGSRWAKTSPWITGTKSTPRPNAAALPDSRMISGPTKACPPIISTAATYGWPGAT